QTKLFENWRLFNFNIIQIELLSEIYEKFLSETDKSLKEDSGAYYTPPALVEFILNEKLPINKTDINYNIKILDPSCGSGIFLVESFKRLVKRYENQHTKRLTDFEKLKKLLTNNIFGIELHPQAIKVAAFSLYLALVDNLDPKTLWQKKKHQLPYLINNPAEKNLHKQGYNLFCRDTIEKNVEIEDIKFDLVVGNPPFGTKNILPSIREYCDNEGFAKEKVLPFLHKATKFSSRGDIALIFNTKVLTNSGGTYQNFRKWLFNECYVEKIYNFSILRKAKKNFGGQLFGDATGPISIVFYRKEQPKNPSEKIAYYAPKTFIKSNLIDGLSIDFTDLKFLPRNECQKPDTKIWKIAMWGGLNDWELIKTLFINHESFKSYLITNHIEFGSGLHPKENEKNKMEIEGEHVETKKIKAYYTSNENTKNIKKEFRGNNMSLFKSPLVLIKEGITNGRILSSYIDFDLFYNKAVYGFSGEDTNKLKSIAILFNSNFSAYFFFLTSSSWGLERDRIVLTEYLKFPFSELNLESIAQLDFSELNFDKESSLLDEQKIAFNFEYWEQKISKLYKLTPNNLIRISDIVTLSIDLFYNQDKSIALNPVSKDQMLNYGGMLNTELNSFLDGQGLFVNAIIYEINSFTPLMMIKLSFEDKLKEISISSESVDEQLKKLDYQLWEEKSQSIYFRKKLNYKTGNDIFIIRPNQRRFWSKSMALEDASELILEILNEN
ncbi:MAG: HsdM family class I SAM-dependent methyltransferase, partial [bacterium]